MKKIVLGLLGIATLVSAVAVSTKAAFLDTGKVSGATFSVGSADMKLLNSLSAGVDFSNLLDVKQGPIFTNLYPGWSEDYALKLYNNGSLNLNVISKSNYATADDPGNLRDYVNVEVFNWTDTNLDGAADPDEVNSTSIAKKTILKWKSEGIPLGDLRASEVKGLLFRFSSDTITDTKQGQSAKYDFEFTGNTDGVTQ